MCRIIFYKKGEPRDVFESHLQFDVTDKIFTNPDFFSRKEIFSIDL